MHSIQLCDIIKSRLRDLKSRKENANERILNIDTTEQQKSQPQSLRNLKRLTKLKRKECTFLLYSSRYVLTFQTERKI